MAARLVLQPQRDGKGGREDLVTLLALGGKPSCALLVKRWEVTAPTVSKWLQVFEGEGPVSRRTQGRVLVIEAPGATISA